MHCFFTVLRSGTHRSFTVLIRNGTYRSLPYRSYGRLMMTLFCIKFNKNNKFSVMFIEWEIFYSSEFKTSNNGPYCIVYCIGEYNAFEGFFVSHFVVSIPATTPFRRFHFNRYINTRSVVILMRLEYFDRLRQSFFISFSFLVQSLEIENKRSPDPHMGMCFCTELKNSFNLKLAISSNLR